MCVMPVTAMENLGGRRLTAPTVQSGARTRRRGLPIGLPVFGIVRVGPFSDDADAIGIQVTERVRSRRVGGPADVFERLEAARTPCAVLSASSRRGGRAEDGVVASSVRKASAISVGVMPATSEPITMTGPVGSRSNTRCNLSPRSRGLVGCARAHRKCRRRDQGVGATASVSDQR